MSNRSDQTAVFFKFHLMHGRQLFTKTEAEVLLAHVYIQTFYRGV